MDRMLAHEYHQPDTTAERRGEILAMLCPHGYKFDADEWCETENDFWTRSHEISKLVPGHRASGIGSAPWMKAFYYRLEVRRVEGTVNKIPSDDIWQAYYCTDYWRTSMGDGHSGYITLGHVGLHNTMRLAELWHWIPPHTIITQVVGDTAAQQHLEGGKNNETITRT